MVGRTRVVNGRRSAFSLNFVFDPKAIDAAWTIVAALAIRNDWASAGLAVAIALLEDLWPVLDIILMAEGYVLIRILMSAGAVLAWWALGRGIRRILRRPALAPAGGGT